MDAARASRRSTKGGTYVENLNRLAGKRLSRRRFLAGIGTGAGAAAALTVAAGCGGHSNNSSSTGTGSGPGTGTGATITDTDILNFALNLEYLEAEFYLRATTGSGLSSTDSGGTGTVTGGAMVPFKTPAIQQYAVEIANDELAHVRFLRKALGSAAVGRPDIDLTNSFNAAAMAAGIGPAFNPFADENSFIVGAFTFEDVGVTAYHGAATLLTVSSDLAAAGGILGTEAYHAGTIRTLLTQLGTPYITYANQISALRASAGGGAETTLSSTSIVACDSSSISWDRTASQVLHIVYLSAMAGVVSKGGFFPSGLNGTITATTT
uniref:Ferritin-like domain-containing protein n=1 Tax=Paracidobacterium acidisoli TaxID=2303751 RepID=A0A372IKY0_9BACT